MVSLDDDEIDQAYAICVDLNGSCSCQSRSRPPCETTMQMAEKGRTARSEQYRIDRNRLQVED